MTEVATDVVQLEDWRYLVDMGCNDDRWRLHGRVFGHPNFRPGYGVFVSTPKDLDEENMILITCSGRKYKLGECDGQLAVQLQYIKDDINQGGTKRC